MKRHALVAALTLGTVLLSSCGLVIPGLQPGSTTEPLGAEAAPVTYY